MESPIFRFVGPSHEEGGIPIRYNGIPAEVEGDETGYVDKSGDLNIFGNMYVPGTNQKFKTLSKKIGVEEQKNEKRLTDSIALMDVFDKDDKYERLKVNSGSVMGKSALVRKNKLSQAKEDLSDLQNQMLDFSQSMGTSPKALFGTKKGSNYFAADGITIPYRRPPLPTQDYSFVPNYTGLPNIEVPYDRLGYSLEPIRGEYRANKSATAPISNKLTNPVPTRVKEAVQDEYYPTLDTPVYREPLSIGQIAPELYALATNRPEFVSTPRYNPALLNPYTVSFRDRLNQNASTFRQLANSSNNPAALASLAAQKYNADQQVFSDEFRTNQSIQNQILNQNVELINQAQLTNLGFQKQADQERSQNLAATKATNREALTSMAAKSLQQKQYNRGLTLFNQLTPNYKYNPDTGQWDFAGGYAPISIAGSPLPNVDYAGMYGETRNKDYVRDSRGKIVRTQERRSPGIMKLFKK